jgi:ABC-2 type transport system ATP-binding protein
MNTVELNKVRKAYDKFIAVDDLSFNIGQGKMFGLLGPNGAGKTSTIRMMIGITMPDTGSVTMFGKPFERDMLKRVGYLPEERGLYQKMNVLEQLMFLGEIHGLTRSDAKKRSEQWGERLEIAEAFGKKTQELSKGMQQKIQFIATLLHEPELIIMDEPASGLDPSNARLLDDVLLDLRKQGRTILFSSHRMDQVEKLCDDICLVNKAKGVLQGNLKEIKASYGKNTLEVTFASGEVENTEPLMGMAGVNQITQSTGKCHIKLMPGTDPQPFFRAIVEKYRVIRIDLAEPSLEEIFIEKVGKTDA